MRMKWKLFKTSSVQSLEVPLNVDQINGALAGG